MRDEAGGGVAAVPETVHGRTVGVVVSFEEARLPAAGFFVLMAFLVTEIGGRVEEEFRRNSVGSQVSGMIQVATVPPPVAGSRVMEPPWSSAASRTKVRPRPVPLRPEPGWRKE